MIKKIFITVIAGFILFLVGLGVYENVRGIYSSDGKQSALKELHYEVTILPDGSSRVDEYRTYHFIKGTFSRGFLDIDGKISGVSVSENDQAYQKLPSFSSSRPPGHHAVNEKSLPARVEWYYLASDNETRTFKVSYTVKATGTLYNDCADYFQKYVSSSNVYKIREFSTIVHLPPGADRDNTAIWAHGPVGGSIRYKDEKTVELSMKNVPPGQYIEARILLPPEALPKSEKTVNADMYEELLERENSASAKSDCERIVNGIAGIAGIIAALVLTLLPVFIRINYQRKLKRYTPKMAPPYYRELPSDIYPAELDYLYNHLTGKESVSRQMAATLLDLIHRGVLRAENVEEAGIFRNKHDIRLIPGSDHRDELARHEKILLDFIFGEVGSGTNEVNISEIEKFCSRKTTAQKAYHYYMEFWRRASKSAWNKGYFETERNALPRGVRFLMPVYVALMVAPMALAELAAPLYQSPLYFIAVGSVAGFLVNIVAGPKQKNMLTQKGEDELALWQAFRDFLSDFTTFDEKELPELIVWEKYLVYATVLGVADKLLKQLFMKYPRLANEQCLLNTGLLYTLDMRGFSQASHNLERIGKSLENAMRSAVKINSKAASRGSGGGFSSGGSDGGGGAGGSSGGVD